MQEIISVCAVVVIIVLIVHYTCCETGFVVLLFWFVCVEGYLTSFRFCLDQGMQLCVILLYIEWYVRICLCNLRICNPQIVQCRMRFLCYVQITNHCSILLMAFFHVLNVDSTFPVAGFRDVETTSNVLRLHWQARVQYYWCNTIAKCTIINTTDIRHYYFCS